MELSKFERYNSRRDGNIFVVSPGLINSISSKDLNRLLTNKDPQIVLLSYFDYNDMDTFIDIAFRLSKEGYQVVLRYDTYVLAEILKRKIKYVSITLDKEIIQPFFRYLQQYIYKEMEPVILDYYATDTIYKVNKFLKENTHRNLVLMNYRFNIKQAITEYLFMKRDRYQYI